MICVTDRNECCGCSACVSACPVQCIKMVPDREGFEYPAAEASACIGCGCCERVCPFKNIPWEAPVLSAWAARSRNGSVLRSSSSGGVFSELCLPVFEAGGVVYGVAMDADCRGCSFVRAEGPDGMAPMRGSKYMQANSLGVYERVAKDLSEGRRVLFSGTPCQSNALVSFLGGTRENLLVVDFVCHGVPSAKLWAACEKDLEESRRRTVISVNFRYKEANGLPRVVETDLEYQPLRLSPYMRMFLSDCCLRPSCYSCRAKLHRSADLTIADFWGVETVVPEMASKFGCSLVLVRTDKGLQALDNIHSTFNLHEVDCEEALIRNPSASASAMYPPARGSFYLDLDNLGYRAVVQRYGSPSALERTKLIIGNALARVGFLEIMRRAFRKRPMRKLRYGLLIEYSADISKT